ncbi:calcium/sodium antiporter [Halorussus gelatinilyticus]|uniref:Calcium/sodium antiporter n=1 Tax=Halorussus gelatinilyticus TaxID=2937524 RepID=A0A8U0IE02_9EURY|nr:calcium/sodium antiporter [Halorussus gelatinilyticus]UPV99162.1 calcium/sodium antiporter [Halorussus gelatinilyticus]
MIPLQTSAELLVSVDALYLLGGILLLYLGAELLVDSASSLAVGYGIAPATVGVTVVAFSTTAPELFVSMVGGIGISDDIGLGNIIGSNIANLGLVLGASALVQPLSVDSKLLWRHGPFMLAAAVLLVVLGSDGMLGQLDGVGMLALLAVFTGYMIYQSRSSDDEVVPDEMQVESESTSANARQIALLVGAGVCLLGGSIGLVQGGTGLLRSFGFSDLFIGITIIAFGTSLPELATSLVSSLRDEAEFSIGNVVGSNIYNVLAVVGLLALVHPLTVNASVQTLHFPVMLAFTVGAMALMAVGRRVSRPSGVALVGAYGGFIYLLLP